MNDVPDKPDFLLRRVPAPIVAAVRRYGVGVELRTNSTTIRDAFLAGTAIADGRFEQVWTLIADHGCDARWSEPQQVTGAPVACVTFGSYAWFAVDFEKRTVTGFVPALSGPQQLRSYLDQVWAIAARPPFSLLR